VTLTLSLSLAGRQKRALPASVKACKHIQSREGQKIRRGRSPDVPWLSERISHFQLSVSSFLRTVPKVVKCNCRQMCVRRLQTPISCRKILSRVRGTRRRLGCNKTRIPISSAGEVQRVLPLLLVHVPHVDRRLPRFDLRACDGQRDMPRPKNARCQCAPT